MVKRDAFTLIELLVVIAIIALLLAILMPSLKRVRQQAKASVCQSNLHQWSLVFSMYDNDYEGRFCNGCSSYNTNDKRHWATALRDYSYHNQQITLCPTATKPYDEGGTVGRRYARMDEIGTPWCVTVDYESKDDKKVTIRDRDSTEQVRVDMDRVPDIVCKLMDGADLKDI